MVTRSKNATLISIKLPAKFLQRLDDFADANEWTRTETLRRGFEALEREMSMVDIRIPGPPISSATTHLPDMD
jgi:hypothetical protein